jgi:hypothetical protein
VSDQAEPLDLHKPARAKKSERTEKQKLREENEESDLKWLMGSERGRRIVWRLLERAGVFQSSFTANALTEAFEKGQRDYGLWVLGVTTEAGPENYAQMLKERADDRNRRADAGRNKSN